MSALKVDLDLPVDAHGMVSVMKKQNIQLISDEHLPLCVILAECFKKN